jgi:hypothetical protein
MTDKHCPRCATTLSVDLFYKNARGYSGWCKQCCRNRTKEQAASGYFVDLRFKKRGGRQIPKPMTALQKASHALWANAMKRATRLGIGFDLTREWTENAVESFCSNNHHSFDTRDPFKPSLDRADSSLGYTQANTKVVWMIENYAKNTFTDDDVLRFCRLKLGL